MSSLVFNNIYVKDYFSIAGPMEKRGQIRKFDMTLDDYYFNESTFEKAEVKMQRVVIDNLLYRNRLKEQDISCIVGGDLTNQIAASNYAIRNFKIPFIGIYNACATFPESLLLSATLLEQSDFKNIISITSSHNLTAEKQFRYPIEYGAPKKAASTFTATGSVGAILTKDKSKIKIESATIGSIVDMDIKDVNHMGAIMAPAAAKVLNDHLEDMKRKEDYYDLILTGDLGEIGAEIFREYSLIKYNIKLKKHLDAGEEIYANSQETNAGASGPVTLPLVLFNKVLKNTRYKKILILGTGALHSPSLVNQKESIPAISHAVSLEVL